MSPEAQARLAQLAPLEQGLQSAWPTLEPWLRSKRDEFLRALVSANNEEARGKIKMLDELLALPEVLQNEAVSLSATPQEEGELP